MAPFILSPIILLSGDNPETVEAMKCAYLILLMAMYWMTEALPLPITSMIPMVSFLIKQEVCLLNVLGGTPIAGADVNWSSCS